jgi:hypothetical protein
MQRSKASTEKIALIADTSLPTIHKRALTEKRRGVIPLELLQMAGAVASRAYRRIEEASQEITVDNDHCRQGIGERGK